MLDPETLRTFVSVAESGSFSRAAEKLYKTTATISYRIKLLEDNTGVALFSRTTRSVLLTRPGCTCWRRPENGLAGLTVCPESYSR